MRVEEKGSQSNDKILLILDLDETLIHASEGPLDRPADFRVFGYYVYKRPHLDAFLRECSRHFALAVWSSASDDYVEAVVQRIIPPEIPLQFVWGRSRCTYCFDAAAFESGGHADAHSHYNYLKVLKKVKKRGYSLRRVLIVDDTPHKAGRNYGNAIYPREYLGDALDDELPQLLRYLLQLKDAENVRTIEKRNWRNNS
jgi:RNA polymerase II subunit A small phosphatase-like protein